MKTNIYKKKVYAVVLILFILSALTFGCSQKLPIPESADKDTADSEKKLVEVFPGYVFRPRGDVYNRGGFDVKPIEKPEILWTFNAGSKVRASTAILPDGRIVTGSLGDRLFILTDKGKAEKEVKLESWVFSSPVVGAGGIYLACDNGDLISFDNNGEVLWKLTLPAETSSTPLVFDNMIYIGAEDNGLHAISPEGKETWKFNTGKRILFSSPAAYRKGKETTITVGAEDGILYAVDKNGALRWKFDTGGEISTSSPLVNPVDGTTYIASSDGLLFALDEEGREIWKYKAPEEVAGSPAADFTDKEKGRIYLLTLDGLVLTIDVKDGKELLRKKGAPRFLSSPVLDRDSNLYAVGSIFKDEKTGKVEKGKVVSFDKKGNLRFEIELDSTKDFEADPVLSKSGQMIFGGNNGKVYCIGDKKD